MPGCPPGLTPQKGLKCHLPGKLSVFLPASDVVVQGDKDLLLLWSKTMAYPFLGPDFEATVSRKVVCVHFTDHSTVGSDSLGQF